MNIYKPLAERLPKAKPLALTLVQAAAEQGACLEELKLACDMAINAYRKALDRSGIALTEFKSEAKTTIEGI